MPFRSRPIQPVGYGGGFTWAQWLVDDQREASGRPDVLAFTSDVLKEPVKISGQPVANLIASTSGTDSDWVVKVIDVYPDEVAAAARDGWISTDGFGGHFPRTVSREPRDAEGDCAGQAAAVSLHAADGEPCISAGTPDHGAGAVELVSAVRPESANICAEYFLGQTRRL